MTPPADPAAQLRRWVYHLIIASALAMACGRIVSVQRVYEPAFHRDLAKTGDRRPLWPGARPTPMATFGSNDRSRFATIRALVNDGTYVIGKRDANVVRDSVVANLSASDPFQAVMLAQTGYTARTTSQSGILFEDGWQTIDAVLHPDTLEFYSSKPPLLSTLLAGLYWLLKQLFGWDIVVNHATVVRTMLVLVNALPFAGYLWLLTRIAERWGKTDWGKLYIVAAGAFGTLVTPFLITLNNHTIGVFCIMLAWYSTLEIWRTTRLPSPFGRGVGGEGCVDAAPSPLAPLPKGEGSCLHYLFAGFFASFAVTCELPALSFATAIFVLLTWWSPKRALLLFLPAALLPAAGFFVTNHAAIGMLKPAYAEFKGPWYQYEGSHWKILPKEFAKKGIDFAKNVESRAEYAMHVLIGHHGLFSLTPIWILALIAMIAGTSQIGSLWRQALFKERAEFPWFVQPMALALTIVVAGFYIRDDSANYGGFTNGLRWMMWLAPIWLTCLIPLADRLAESCWLRSLGVTLLAISTFSACYQMWNPWRHPWIFDLMIELGWKGY